MIYTRHEIARMAMEDSWQGCVDGNNGRFIVHFLPPERMAEIAAGNPDQIYRPHGIVPVVLDMQLGVLDIGFCLDWIVDQTARLSDDQFVAYLLYWNSRLKVRLGKEMTLEDAQDGQFLSPADEGMLEELVELEMDGIGFPRWWEGLLV